jgi:hypothetical protein
VLSVGSVNMIKWILKVCGTPLASASPADQGIKQINAYPAVGGTAGTLPPQTFTAATGTGSLELARGTTHVVDGATTLTGERTIVGPFTSSTWAAASKANLPAGTNCAGHTGADATRPEPAEPTTPLLSRLPVVSSHRIIAGGDDPVELGGCHARRTGPG